MKLDELKDCEKNPMNIQRPKKEEEAVLTGPDFRKLVNHCKTNNIDRDIYNASFDHALELADVLFKKALEEKKPIKIISGDLCTQFYGTLCNIADKILDEGIKIEAIVSNPNCELHRNRFANMLINKGSLYLALHPIRLLHFILVGDKSYRLETDHDQSKAVANFNNISIGQVLFQQFNTAIKSEQLQEINPSGLV